MRACPGDHLRGYFVIALFMEAHFDRHPQCKLRSWVCSYQTYADIRCLNGLCRYHELLAILRAAIHEEPSTSMPV